MRTLTSSLLLALAAASAHPHPAAAQPAPGDTVRYVAVSAGRESGHGRVWREADGTVASHMEYNDRGRGPSITTRVRLDARGMPVWMEAEGVNYYKVPVRERYELSDGRAVWENSADRGERAVTGPAWYSAVDASMDNGILPRALLASPDRSLPILPEGRVRIEPGPEAQVSAGGRTMTVRQYAIHGFGFTPYRLWLDEELQFFASGGDWLAFVREGWEGSLPVLFRADQAAEAAWGASLPATLAHRPAGPVAIRNANLFDAETGASRPGTTVVIEGNRIRAVGADGSVAIPQGAQVIDAAGKALLPGLWDMHVHLDLADGPMHLGAGVTSVRDLANDTVVSPQVAREWNAGTKVGPWVVMSGFIDGSGPFTGPTGLRVDTPEQARAAVAFYADRGYEQIKMYSSLKPELVPVVVEEAHRRGLRVSGHIPEGMTAAEAVRAGFDEIQHANFLFLNFLSDTLDTRTPQRFSGPAAHGAEIDLQGDSMRAFVALLRERGTVLDPTLNVFHRLFTSRQGELDPVLAAVAGRLPATVQRGLRSGGGLPVPEGMDARYRASFDAMLRMIAMMHREGVTIVPGTDALAGFSLHHELELYERAGIRAADVLRLATLGSARVARRDRDLGSITPGKLADLILVDGDPARRVSDVRNVELVIKDGVLYRPDELWGAVGVGPRVGNGQP